jgi:hypothetical protein
MLRTALAHLRAQWMGALALFLVIAGGTAYAADTIGSADIIDGQVKSADIGNNQVRSTDVRDDALPGGGLRSEDLADASVQLGDLATGAVNYPALDIGTLPQFTYQKQSSTATDTTTSKELSVSCTGASEAVTGGGYVLDGAEAYAVRSYAVDRHTWLVRAHSVSASPAAWQLTVVADCLS